MGKAGEQQETINRNSFKEQLLSYAEHCARLLLNSILGFKLSKIINMINICV